MPTFYSSQFNQAYIQQPPQKIPAGELNGQPRIAYFEYTVGAVVNGDDVLVAKIPQGARVLDVVLSIPDLGSAGVVNVGWSASANGLEAASTNGFYASLDVFTAAQTLSLTKPAGAAPVGFGKKFLGEVDLRLLASTAWNTPTGVIRGYVQYILE